MDLLLVRHGESEGNAQGRLQGAIDSPLSAHGRSQATLAGDWLRSRGLRWEAAYCSPLARAHETARIIAERSGYPGPEVEPALHEVKAGALEGLTRQEMLERYPQFASKTITDLGDFSDAGGESYAEIQARVGGVLERLVARHREAADRILVVAHGGVNFQLTKLAICVPVPRVCILSWGNCTVSLLRFRDRRGHYMAEIVWHVPVELMGAETGDVSTGLFR